MSAKINRGRKSRPTSWRSHSKIVNFRSAVLTSASEELDRQTEDARRSNVLRVPDFDDQYWPISSRARASDAGSGGLHFTIDRAKKGTRLEPFPEPFLSFAKVMVCSFEGRSDRGYSATNLQTVVASCRWLYRQFGQREPIPHLLTHGDFEAAAQAAQSEMGEGAANIGSKLAFISRQMDSMHLGMVPIDWRNSITRKGKHTAIGPVADRRRNELMPDPRVIDALAEISSRSDLDHRDLLLQRGIDLCVSVGFRVNELLTLPRLCLVIEPELDEMGAQVLDRFGHPRERIGLRYWPEKGARNCEIKWVPPVMNEVVKRAVNDIQAITKPSWLAAVHQFSNPGSTLMGEPWDEVDGETTISPSELKEAIRVADPYQFIRINKLSDNSDSYARGLSRDMSMRVSLASLRSHLFERSERGNVLRAGEGHQDLSECLFVVPEFFVKRTMNGGLSGTVNLLKDANLNVYLVGIKSSPSIFERLEYLDDCGEPLRCPTHSIRHWLNTLALEGGLSDVDLARWMSRQNLAQNRAYDHRSPVDRARRAGEKMRKGEAAGPVARAIVEIKDPVRREEFTKSLYRTAHVTDLGTCVHDWDALPCQKHGSCWNCFELRVEKGNLEQRQRSELALQQTQAELDEALSEEGDGTIGADRWVETHTRTIASLKKIIAIHDDPTIPDGFLVEVDHSMPTHED